MSTKTSTSNQVDKVFEQVADEAAHEKRTKTPTISLSRHEPIKHPI
jgi:hypothetical protein